MVNLVDEEDYVDLIASQWAHERPDLDTAGLQVIGRVSRLSRYLEHAIETSFAPYGLNSSGFYVLAALRRNGAPYQMSPTQLYSSLLVSSGAMTNRIDRLEAAGFVARLPDATDGRGSLVALTAEGRRVVEAAIEAHSANEIRLLSGLTADEQVELGRLMRKLLLKYGDLPDPRTWPVSARRLG
jgi:DNA-binding MarR family transcriptional regulator